MRDLLSERLTGYAPRQLALDYPEAGILVPVTNDCGSPELIFTLRSQKLATHRGQVAFPGGKRDRTDASLIDTALREAHEEIGLPPNQVDMIAPLGQVASGYGILVTPYVGVVPQETQLTANLDEIESIFKVPVGFFLEDRRVRTDALPFENDTVYVPCYQWERYQIWGMSALVLVDFLNAVYGTGIDILEPRT